MAPVIPLECFRTDFRPQISLRFSASPDGKRNLADSYSTWCLCSGVLTKLPLNFELYFRPYKPSSETLYHWGQSPAQSPPLTRVNTKGSRIIAFQDTKGLGVPLSPSQIAGSQCTRIISLMASLPSSFFGRFFLQLSVPRFFIRDCVVWVLTSEPRDSWGQCQSHKSRSHLYLSTTRRPRLSRCIRGGRNMTM